MSLRAREPPQNRVYVCIIGFHSFTLSKLWRRFSQLFVFSKIRFIKKNRTQSVFMLQKWLAYQNIAKRITNNSSDLDFSFSALFFFNMDLKSKNCRKTTNFSIFLLKASWKKNSDLIWQKQIRASLPYCFSFILIDESYLYYENSPTSILFSRGVKRCFFFEKNAIISKKIK